MALCSSVFKAEDETRVAVVPPAERRKGAFSNCSALKCQRSDSASVDTQKHHKAGHRYFINTWKWRLSWALDSKCNFLSAISPRKEAAEKERFNFKL